MKNTIITHWLKSMMSSSYSRRLSRNFWDSISSPQTKSPWEDYNTFLAYDPEYCNFTYEEFIEEWVD